SSPSPIRSPSLPRNSTLRPLSNRKLIYQHGIILLSRIDNPLGARHGSAGLDDFVNGRPCLGVLYTPRQGRSSCPNHCPHWRRTALRWYAKSRSWVIFVRDRLSGSWGAVASPTATVPRPATLAM